MNELQVETYIKSFYQVLFEERNREKTAELLSQELTYLDNTGAYANNSDEFLSIFFGKENKQYKVSGFHFMSLNVVLKAPQLALVFCDSAMKTSLKDERYANVRTKTQLVVRETDGKMFLEHIWCVVETAEGLRNNSMKLRRELLAEEYEEYRTHIFAAITMEYDTMAVINLDTGMMDVIKKDCFMESVDRSDVLATIPYEDFVGDLVTRRIGEESKESLIEQIGLEALRFRFRNLRLCHYFYPCKMRNIDKEERWYRFRFSEYEQGMNVDQRVFLAVIDLNDVITKASELQKENHILNRIQNRMLSAIFVAQDDTASVRVLQCHDEFKEILEDSNLRTIVSRLQPQIHEEDFHKFAEALLPSESQNIGTQQILMVEYRRKLKGEYIWEHISVIPDYDEELHQHQRIFVLQDVTDVKNKEKMTQILLEETLQRANAASEAKSIFLSQVSHETRTPLNSVSNAAIYALANLDNKERVEKSLHKIMSSVDMMDSIVGDVLDMSTIESGRANLDNQNIRISALLAHVRSQIEPMARAKDVTYTVYLPIKLHDQVEADQRRIEQILINLLSNSVKYTGKGGSVSLSIQERPSSRWEYAEYVFIIKDNGIGMSKEFQEHLFEPFTREQDERSAHERGTGLGMSIVDNLLKRMGGTIKVHSEKSIGTTIEIALTLHVMEDLLVPIQEVAELAELNDYKKNDNVVELMKERFTNLRVLLVEDNENNLEIEKDIMEMLGLKVDAALDGQKAMDLFGRSTKGYYDVIFMDINMPNMNGFLATKNIRKMKHPDASTIAIYAMSANAGKADVERSIQSGMNAHLSKPIELAQIIRLLRQAEERKR